MKKFVSLVLAMVLLATMLTVFGIPAFAAKTYSLKFEINWPEGKAGNCRNMPSYTGNYPMKIDLPIPSYVEGYNFEGWCEKSDLSDTPIKAIPANTTGDKTFYGKWKKNDVSTITYHTDGGTFCDSRDIPVVIVSQNTYTVDYYEGESTRLLDITKDGYYFYGWYNNAEFRGNRITEITKNETGNKEFWAKFCNHSGMTKMKMGSALKEQYEEKYYYFCEKCGNYFNDANGESFLADKNDINSLLSNWCEKHIIAYYYIDASLDSSDNVKLSDEYIDVKKCKAVTGNDTAWGTENDDTWYVVNGSVELKNRPVVKGNVHIILRDYATLTANHGITVEEGNSISFYAQSDDENTMGKLTAETAGVTAIGGRNGNDAAAEEETSYIQPGGDGGAGGDIYFCGGSILLKSKDAVCIGGGNGGHGQIHKYAGDVIKQNGSDGGNGGKSGKVYFYGGNVLLENNNTACIGGGNGGDGGYSIHLDMNKKETRVKGTDGSKGQPGSFTAENDLIVYGTPVMKAGTSAESAILLNAVTDYTNQSFLSVQYNSVSALGSVLSNGSIWIIAAVAVVAVAGVATLVIVKKKKKPVLANGTDEE